MAPNYVVAIPSYRRSDILQQKTLKMLRDGGVNMSRVYVFVANEEEVNAYKQLKENVKIVVGRLGITNQRAFIRSYFPPKTCIVSIDDDVECMSQLDPITNKLIPFKDVHVFLEKAFKELKKNRLRLWGIFPTPNPFYMKGQSETSTSLKFVIGAFYGFINSHNDIILSDIEEKEDIETTIQYYMLDGGILRYNHIAFKTRFKNPKGGLGGIERRLEANKKAAEVLAKKYPGCTRIKVRKNGLHEIVLRMRGPSCTVARDG